MSWNITEEHKTHLSAFFTDFWHLVKAFFEAPEVEDPDSDQYWQSLIMQCDALMKKHNDPLINRLVMAYLDAQSCKQCPEGRDNHE